jgi:DNA invertase Pin-like site-specific DNA recombinase
VIRKAKNTKSILPPVCYSYIRVSSAKQFISQLGLEAQEHMSEEYRKRFLGDMLFGGLYQDPFAVSASVPFFKREAGSTLHKRLKAGDHIIFPSVDRAFRSARDAHNTVEVWKQMGVHVHFIREGQIISDDNPMGQVFFTMLVACAEMERLFASMRTKAAQESKRLRGEKRAGRTGIRYTNDRNVPGGLRPDDHNTQCMNYALWLFEKGHPKQHIYLHFLEARIRMSNGKEWSPRMFRKYIDSPDVYGLDPMPWPGELPRTPKKMIGE